MCIIFVYVNICRQDMNAEEIQNWTRYTKNYICHKLRSPCHTQTNHSFLLNPQMSLVIVAIRRLLSTLSQTLQIYVFTVLLYVDLWVDIDGVCFGRISNWTEDFGNNWVKEEGLIVHQLYQLRSKLEMCLSWKICLKNWAGSLLLILVHSHWFSSKIEIFLITIHRNIY